MNRLELIVYNRVKRNPELKRRIRNVYQRVFDLLPVESVSTPYKLTVRENFFFGFHDKCPWSPDNKMLLANKFDVPLRMPQTNDTLTVGYFWGDDYATFRPISETRAWTWQLGCMLQWLGNTNQIVFNDFDGSRHVARIYDADGCHMKDLPLPVGAISPNGGWAASWSFERCRVYAPGYGYANGVDPELDVAKPIAHGLHLLNLKSGETKMLFSVRDVASTQPEASMDGAFHYLTHCLFAPSSERFIFLHAWIDGFNAKWIRMISCDLKGNCFVFPTDGMVSHFAWRDDEHVLAYARVKERGDRYVLFRDRSNAREIIGEDSFNSDGHPSFSPDKRWIVTDTYPDRFRISYLILYDTRMNERLNLAKLRSPRQYSSPTFENNCQCDLHPRWDRLGTMICFDSVHTGKRALCTLRPGDSADLNSPRCLE